MTTKSLSLLKQIASLDKDVVELMQVLEEAPRRLKKLDEEESEGHGLVQTCLQESHDRRKALDGSELQLKEWEDKIQKLETQLNTIKKNDEYTLVKKQIADSMDKKAAVEEQILTQYDEVENCQLRLQSSQEEFQNLTTRLEQSRKDIQESTKYTRERLLVFESQKNELLPQLDHEWEMKYCRLFDHFHDQVIVPLQNERCQGCHMRATPETVSQATAGVILECNSCGRILYYQP